MEINREIYELKEFNTSLMKLMMKALPAIKDSKFYKDNEYDIKSFFKEFAIYDGFICSYHFQLLKHVTDDYLKSEYEYIDDLVEYGYFLGEHINYNKSDPHRYDDVEGIYIRDDFTGLYSFSVMSETIFNDLNSRFEELIKNNMVDYDNIYDTMEEYCSPIFYISFNSKATYEVAFEIQEVSGSMSNINNIIYRQNFGNRVSKKYPIYFNGDKTFFLHNSLDI